MELDSVEQNQFRALPREIEPPELLEERAIRALRERGVLRAAAGRRHMPSWLPASAAAAAVFFAVGLGLGQWLGSQSVTRAIVAASEQSALQQALVVQQTGTAYVNALSTLSRLAGSGDVDAVTQGREVALTALYAAAAELARMAPADPLPTAIKRAFDIAREPPDSESRTDVRNEVWF
jgi:hypothetical protein